MISEHWDTEDVSQIFWIYYSSIVPTSVLYSTESTLTSKCPLTFGHPSVFFSLLSQSRCLCKMGGSFLVAFLWYHVHKNRTEGHDRWEVTMTCDHQNLICSPETKRTPGSHQGISVILRLQESYGHEVTSFKVTVTLTLNTKIYSVHPWSQWTFVPNLKNFPRYWVPQEWDVQMDVRLYGWTTWKHNVPSHGCPQRGDLSVSKHRPNQALPRYFSSSLQM